MKSKSRSLLNYKININNCFSIVIEIYNHNNYKVVGEKLLLQCNLKKISRIKGENHRNLHLKFRNKMTHNNRINNLFNKRSKVIEEKYKES